MMNPKKTCKMCHKVKRVYDLTTYEDYGACSTCVGKMGIDDYPPSPRVPSLAMEVNPYDLYMDRAVNKYAAQRFRGLL